MISVPNREIIDCRESLPLLMRLGFPARKSMELANLIEVLDGQLRVIQHIRKPLIEKHSPVNKETNRPMPLKEGTPEHDAFVENFNAILDTEVELKCEPVVVVLKENQEITPLMLFTLRHFIKVEIAENGSAPKAP